MDAYRKFSDDAWLRVSQPLDDDFYSDDQSHPMDFLLAYSDPIWNAQGYAEWLEQPQNVPSTPESSNPHKSAYEVSTVLDELFPEFSTVTTQFEDLEAFRRLAEYHANNASPAYNEVLNSTPASDGAQHTIAHLEPLPKDASTPRTSSRGSGEIVTAVKTQPSNEFICWDHGCNGKRFSTQSNLTRHRRENSSTRKTYSCAKCGAIFSRRSARNQHLVTQSCARIRRYSNGRERPNGVYIKSLQGDGS